MCWKKKRNEAQNTYTQFFFANCFPFFFITVSSSSFFGRRVRVVSQTDSIFRHGNLVSLAGYKHVEDALHLNMCPFSPAVSAYPTFYCGMYPSMSSVTFWNLGSFQSLQRLVTANLCGFPSDVDTLPYICLPPIPTIFSSTEIFFHFLRNVNENGGA